MSGELNVNSVNSEVVVELLEQVGTWTSEPIYTRGAKGIRVYFRLSGVPASGTDTVTPKVLGVDEGNDQTDTILAGPALARTAGVSTHVLRVYPGIAAVANYAASDVLPSVIRLQVAHSGASEWDYSLYYTLIF